MNYTKYIINALLANRTINELTGGAVLPVIARFGTPSPYIVVRTDAVDCRYGKAGTRVGETANVNILCVADSYGEMAQIAEEVAKLCGETIEISSYRESWEEPDKLVAEIVVIINN